MEKIVYYMYKSKDGKIWNTENECRLADENYDFRLKTPKELLRLREILIKIFAHFIDAPETKEYLQDYFVINKNLKIEFKFSCANNQFTKGIADLFIILSGLPRSFISFSEFNNCFCILDVCYSVYKKDNPWYNKDLIYLEKELIKLKKNKKSYKKP